MLNIKEQLAIENETEQSLLPKKRKDYKIIEARLWNQKEVTIGKTLIKTPELIYETKPLVPLEIQKKSSKVVPAVLIVTKFDQVLASTQLKIASYKTKPITENIKGYEKDINLDNSIIKRGTSIHLVKTKLFKQNQINYNSKPRKGLSSFTQKWMKVIENGQ